MEKSLNEKDQKIIGLERTKDVLTWTISNAKDTVPKENVETTGLNEN